MNSDKSQSSIDGSDIRILWERMWRGRWLIASSTIVCTLLLTAYAFLATPIYRSTVMLVPSSIERSGGTLGSTLGQLGSLAAIAGINVGTGDAETEEALAVLRSRGFTEKFILDKNLMPVIFSDAWDSSGGKWKVAKADEPTAAKAYKFFDKSIRTITEDKKTGLITLQIDWRDRYQAADWVNELVTRINSEMRSRAVVKADAAVGFLEKELKSTADIGTRDAINRLIEAQIKQRMLANVTESYVLRPIDWAKPSDMDDRIFPKKRLLIIAGLFTGLLGGAFGVLVGGVLRGEI